jgi:hypothetical protein
VERDREQLEGVKDVDGQIAQRPVTRRRRNDERREVEPPEQLQPRIQDGGRIPRQSRGVELHGRFEAEQRRELGDVQDRRRDVPDEQRRDGRAARRDPALVSVWITDVQCVELDAVCAKELLGRATRRSGGLPEKDGALGHAATLAPGRSGNPAGARP